MNYMLCRNRVRNFDHWKGVFDSHADAHRAAGLKLVHLWYELNNPRNVFFLFEAEDVERARAFLENADTGGAERESGLIEGDYRFFGQSLGYGPLNDEESRQFTAVAESVATKDASELAAAAPATSVAPAPVPGAQPEKRPELEKSMEREKTAESVQNTEPVKNAEPEKTPATVKTTEPENNPTRSEPVKATESAKRLARPDSMKGPVRAKNATPPEPFEGWQPVENWPPAEAAAESSPEQRRPPRGRWVRMKY